MLVSSSALVRHAEVSSYMLYGCIVDACMEEIYTLIPDRNEELPTALKTAILATPATGVQWYVHLTNLLCYHN